MQFKKPKFWDSKKLSIFSILLWPCAKLLEFYNLIKVKKNITFSGIKTICVGNIYIGGTGKTSLAISISKILKKKNIKYCFIKKFYKNQIDEIRLLEKYGKVFSEHDRVNCLTDAIKDGYEFAIFDDGLQDYSINYDIKLLCFNNINWIGNGLSIPAGPLRENINSLKKYNYIFINGNLENLKSISNYIYRANPESKIFNGTYIPIDLNKFDLSEKYLAFSGIGNHQTFVSMLKKNNFKVIKDIEFPDHYDYQINDINKIYLISNKLDCNIITTEKDFLRLSVKNKEKIRFVKAELHINEKEKLINTLLQINE